MHRPTPRDWLLLATGSTYKFTLTGFYFVTLFAVLKQQNYDLNRLSWLQLIGGIEAGKVLFAALMERRVSERFGRFRLWLLGATAVLTATFILMSDSSITANFPLLAALCLLVAAAGTVYGCAMLGLSCVLLPPHERGFGGVVQTMAARGGKMIGGALVLWLYQQYGWTAAVSFVMAFSVIMFAQLAVYREPASPAAADRLPALAARLVSFWRQPETGLRWLVLLFTAAMPYAFAAATFVPKLIALGFTPLQTGNILTVAIPVACLIVTPWAGRLSRRMPRGRLMFMLYSVQFPLLAAMMLADRAAAVSPYLAAAQIAALSVSYTLLMPVLLALVMDKSAPETAALDSSLQFSVILLGTYGAGFFALRTAQTFGYTAAYGVALVLGLAAGAALWFGRNRLDIADGKAA